MRKFGNEKNEEMRKWENERMREWGNEEMRKWGGVTRKVLAEGLSVYSTLPKVVAQRAINFGKVCTAKMMCWDY